LDITISNFDLSGISSKAENRTLLLEERNSVLKEHIDLVLNEYFVLDKKLKKYQHSKLVQLVERFQTSKIYKLFR
jgi:hypothetical protein